MPNSTKFAMNLDSVRIFLRKLSYGCYPRNAFEEFGMSRRTYDENLQLVHFFLPLKHLAKTKYGKSVQYHFLGDTYHESFNYLSNVFCIKAFSPMECLEYFAILESVSESEKPLSVTQIADSVSDILYDFETKDGDSYVWDNSTGRRRIRDLHEIGFLKKIKSGKSDLFIKELDYLSRFSKEELAELYQVTDFYKQVSLLSFPGHMLQKKLEAVLKIKRPSPSFQFKHNNFVRILDNEIIAHLLTSISEKRIISFLYQGKKIQGLPLLIATDYLYSREYLYLISEKGTASYRIDFIQKLKTEKDTPQQTIPFSAENIFVPYKTMHIRIYYDSEKQKEQLIQELKKEFTKIEILPPKTKRTKTNSITGKTANTKRDKKKSSDLLLYCIDPLQKIPYFRTLGSAVEILPSDTSDSLRKRMYNDLKEALDNYGQPV